MVVVGRCSNQFWAGGKNGSLLFSVLACYHCDLPAPTDAPAALISHKPLLERKENASERDIGSTPSRDNGEPQAASGSLRGVCRVSVFSRRLHRATVVHHTQPGPPAESSANAGGVSSIFSGVFRQRPIVFVACVVKVARAVDEHSGGGGC